MRGDQTASDCRIEVIPLGNSGPAIVGWKVATRGSNDGEGSR